VGVGIGGVVRGHHEATAEVGVSSPWPDGDNGVCAAEEGGRREARVGVPVVDLPHGWSTCSAATQAHGTRAPEVLRSGGVALGRGTQQAEVNERGGSEGAQMGFDFGRGGDNGDGEHGRTWGGK
jgi:hypothetical protein